MSLLDKLFGKKPPQLPSTGPATPTAGRNRQLPSTQVAKEFGEVDVLPVGGHNQITFTILMEPTGAEAEGWQTGVALDASASMQGPFGRLLLQGPKGPLPDLLKTEYKQKGWITQTKQDGSDYIVYSTPALEDALKRGHFIFSNNEIEPLAREFTTYLADNLDADGGTTVIYWACGDGAQIELISDLTVNDCQDAAFPGPQNLDFGNATYLTPAMRYFVERFKDAKRGMYLFITDGCLDDLEAVKNYTISLCQDIEQGRRNPLKCVLIGLGNQIDERQMEDLDDLESGTHIDIWDHKIAKEMRDLKEIFAEVVSENQIVAPTARIYDATGKIIQVFSDGLPAKVSFYLPIDSDWFELEVAGKRIKQFIR